MLTAEREAVAAAFFDAWRERTLCAAPSARPEFGNADAFAIGERVRALRIAAGALPVGYKVGFTNDAVRAQFNAPGPLSATVYADTVRAGYDIEAATLLGPRIEPEIVVGIGAGGRIEWAALGFEIVQSHVADWQFGYLDALVDFGLHAALFIGERRAITAADAEDFTRVQVELSCNGALVKRGAGSDVQGGAPGSVAWLRGDLKRANRELLTGELVSTGSMTRVPAIAAGERWSLTALGADLAPLSIDVR